jgi:hypothetical protein
MLIPHKHTYQGHELFHCAHGNVAAIVPRDKYFAFKIENEYYVGAKQIRKKEL